MVQGRVSASLDAPVMCVRTVVNIDAGFVAGMFAARIANLAAGARNERAAEF